MEKLTIGYDNRLHDPDDENFYSQMIESIQQVPNLQLQELSVWLSSPDESLAGIVLPWVESLTGLSALRLAEMSLTDTVGTLRKHPKLTALTLALTYTTQANLRDHVLDHVTSAAPGVTEIRLKLVTLEVTRVLSFGTLVTLWRLRGLTRLWVDSSKACSLVKGTLDVMAEALPGLIDLVICPNPTEGCEGFTTSPDFIGDLPSIFGQRLDRFGHYFNFTQKVRTIPDHGLVLKKGFTLLVGSSPPPSLAHTPAVVKLLTTICPDGVRLSRNRVDRRLGFEDSDERRRPEDGWQVLEDLANLHLKGHLPDW